MLGNRNFIESPKKIFSKKFIIAYVIFLVIAIYFTALFIDSSIKAINKNEEINILNMLSSEFNLNELKKAATSNKYAVASYDETYDSNSLKIVNYYDIDGNVSQEDKTDNIKYRIHFIQIDGLKNKTVQNKINERLKQKAYALAFNDSFVYSNVTANFSNLLSVMIYTGKEVDTVNVDLSNGNDIAFEDIFISSTTINSYLANALYKALAWNNVTSLPDRIYNSRYEFN